MKLNMSLSELENMYPFERDVYVAIIVNNIEKAKQENTNG